MKTPEEILLDLLENSGVVHATIQKYPEFERSIIKAMEEYAKSYSNHLAESYSDLEGENKRLCSMYESEKNRLVLRTMERDNWEMQFKEADKRCREMGTKNAELYDAWLAVSKDKDRFVKALETCMYYSDPFRVHTDLDYDIIHKTAQKEIQAI